MKTSKIVGAQRRKLQRHVTHQGHDIIALGLVIEPSRASNAMADPQVRGEPEGFTGIVFVTYSTDISGMRYAVRNGNLHVIKRSRDGIIDRQWIAVSTAGHKLRLSGQK